MSPRILSLLAPLLALPQALPAQVPAGDAPITAADLRPHIDSLASDAFEGRQPATPGEALTTNYLSRALAARGVEPAGPDGSWLQPVAIVERGVGRHETRWVANGRRIAVADEALVLTSRDPRARIASAPVVFAGHGAVMPDRGIDQLAGADFRGAVALVLYEGPAVDGFPSFQQRIAALAEAGAVAVIGITAPDLPFAQVRRAATQGAVALDGGPLPAAYGVISWDAAMALFEGAGRDLQAMLNEQPGSSFRSVSLPVRAGIDVMTEVRRYTTNNVVGRIRGSAGGGESVLLLGHWDHVGICRPEGAPDRICNGAVDNASGMATLVEAAGRLGAGARPQRDILILATTAEEIGLLGAEHFARNPVVPSGSIVAAVNVDTAAIHPAGMPVAMIGGTAEMRAVAGRVASGLGRHLDADQEADLLAERQDGWALVRNGIPAMMAGGSFSDMRLLVAFLNGAYHGPDDEASDSLELAGAAEDATLLVALARAFADPAAYQPAAR
ncbi:M28 family peptidase [Sphingosinicella sp. YJ22]|uniref:M28 family peptidase n=1 Tax=Sphingosinicella sp. YJ22 TaxID=1104780 RepID=UPI00140A18C1|nr:M28 family peptidase [Sphingosinicella sp. YJ22]